MVCRDQARKEALAPRLVLAEQTLPANLPRVEKIVACTASQCVCGKCRKETIVIGYEETEVLNVKLTVVLRRSHQAQRSAPAGSAKSRCGHGAAAAADHRERAWCADQVIIDTIVE